MLAEATYIAPVVTALIGGGFLAGVAALLKIRPEAGQVAVLAAQGAVIAQTSVVDNLKNEMARLVKRVGDLEDANAELLRENVKLKRQIARHEAEIAELRGNQNNHDGGS